MFRCEFSDENATGLTLSIIAALVRDITFLHAVVFSATCSRQLVLVGRRLALLGWPVEQRDMSDRSREGALELPAEKKGYDETELLCTAPASQN